MKPPIWLTVIFIVISLIANVGMVSEITSGDSSTEEKIMKGAIAALNTPNNVDDFFSESIIKAYTAEDENERRIMSGLAFFAALAYFLVWNFFYHLIKWLLGLARFVETRERKPPIAFIMTVLIMGILTWGFTSFVTIWNYIIPAIV